MRSVTKTCYGCATEVWCCHSVVFLEWKGKRDFFLSGCSECLRFSYLLWPYFGFTPQEKPFDGI